MARAQADGQGSVITGSSVVAAGLASALAATVSSGFGIAGTLIGAALTTMIITAGSSILNAYLQSLAEKAKATPGNFRSAARRRKPRIHGEWIPGQPGVRNSFMGRLRASVNWFSQLPSFKRRSIIRRGLMGTVAAFAVGLVTITAVEAGIGSTLSCAVWQRGCVSSAPGAGYGAVPQQQPSGGTSLGRAFGGGGGASNQQAVPAQQDAPAQQGVPDGQQNDGGWFGGDEVQPSQGVPGQQDGGGWLDGGQPEQPIQPAQPGQSPQPTPLEPEQPTPQQPDPQQPAPQQPAPQQPVPQQPTPQQPGPQQPAASDG